MHLFRQLPLLVFAAFLLATCGCSSSAPKDANPVVGPAPSRTSLVNSAETITEADLLAGRDRPGPSGVRQVEFNRQTQPLEFSDADTIAYVNGEPILVGEVLEPYAGQIAQLAQKSPPEQLAKLRKQLLERDLPIHVDNKILVQAFESTLDNQQREMLDDAMDGLFGEQLDKMMQDLGVTNTHLLDVELQKRHSSLAAVKRSFANKVMAQEFMRSKLPTIPEPSRADLIRYYNEHLDDYEILAKARWEQIEISYDRHGGKQGATKVLSQAADELLSGAEFAQVAKKYSDGPGAEQGGFWDWTEEGSLKDKTIEKAIFTEPIGQVSDVFAGDTSFQVNPRRPASAGGLRPV